MTTPEHVAPATCLAIKQLSLNAEAQECRRTAAHCGDLREKQLLLRLARAFDDYRIATHL
jgi:hypothetical protein